MFGCGERHVTLDTVTSKLLVLTKAFPEEKKGCEGELNSQPGRLKSSLWVITPLGRRALLGSLWKLMTFEVKYVNLLPSLMPTFKLVFRKHSLWDNFGITYLTCNFLTAAGLRQRVLLVLPTVPFPAHSPSLLHADQLSPFLHMYLSWRPFSEGLLFQGACS